MTKKELRYLLRQFKNGERNEESVLETLAALRFESMGFATIDHHRQLRQGFPEVILCEGKTPKQVAAIAGTIGRGNQPLLATRARKEQYIAVRRIVRKAVFDPVSRTITANPPNISGHPAGMILVITAGTSDLPVAEEAAVTARMFGNRVEKLYDVGVAGIHRLLSQSHTLMEANVIIVVAGMEGALPSVVGGLVEVPVIAVPTSVGYGSSFGGVAALLGMLNSCSSGVTVVNIDNGFGAGFAAALMNRRR